MATTVTQKFTGSPTSTTTDVFSGTLSSTVADVGAPNPDGSLSGYFRPSYFAGWHWQADHFRGDTGFIWSRSIEDKMDTGTGVLS